MLCSLIGWLHNVHVLTTNGMYKSIDAEPWIADPAHARLDRSNYLYFPLYGAMARGLDAVGILKGVPWKQLAYLNAFWASLAIVVVYAFIYAATRSVLAAAFAACFHLGCGYFLSLAVINEDIMPGYTLVLAAMALAGLSFGRPSLAQVVTVGVLFSLGWLIEWRLIFPTLPALALALALSGHSPARRATLVCALLASILVVAWVASILSAGHNGAVGLLGILWTGKGVDTGWAGLSVHKLWLMLSGLGNYLLFFGLLYDPASAERAVIPLAVSVLLQVGILAASIVMLWPQRNSRRVRAIAVVFLGTFAAGEVFNLYSQPQDPQMQINVMAWLTAAWGLLLAAVAARSRPWAMVLCAAALLPAAWNFSQLAQYRRGDTAAVAALDALERRFPPASTVFVYWGFETIATWQFALWSRTWDWDGEANLPTAPVPDPKFKWVAITAGAIRHPSWSAEQHASAIEHDINQALDRGYWVLISDVWAWSETELKNQLAALSAGDRSDAIYRMLHDNYAAEPVHGDAAAGAYYELKRR